MNLSNINRHTHTKSECESKLLLLIGFIIITFHWYYKLSILSLQIFILSETEMFVFEKILHSCRTIRRI